MVFQKGCLAKKLANKKMSIKKEFAKRDEKDSLLRLQSKENSPNVSN